MPQLTANCPRCKATKTTFDLEAVNHGWVEHDWMNHFEAFSVCRHCHRSTMFIIAQRRGNYTKPMNMPGSVNDDWNVVDHVSLKDETGAHPPEHLPPKIEAAFREGATCVAVRCYNAAAGMFRLCVDHATAELLPASEIEGITPHIRRNLTPRLEWLFKTGRLPAALRDLSSCIKDDGNDAVHAGNLEKADAEDLQDFAFELLERLYTEPKRLELAQQRRQARRVAPPQK